MEKQQTLADLLKQLLAADRTLLARSDDLVTELKQHPPKGFRALRERRSIERALRETRTGERLLTADGGTAEAQAAVIEQALADLLAIGMQEDAALRTLEILVGALGWDAGDATDAPAPPAPPDDEPHIDFRALNDYLAEREGQFQTMQKNVRAAMDWVQWLQSELAAVEKENAALQAQCTAIQEQAQQNIACVRAEAAQNIAAARAEAAQNITAARAAAEEQAAALREELQKLRAELDARDQKERDELHAELQRLRDEQRAAGQRLREEVPSEFRSLHDEQREAQKHAAPQTATTASNGLTLSRSQLNAWKRCLAVYHEQFAALQDAKTTFLTQQKLFKTWKVIGLGCANKFDRMSDPALPAIFQKSALADYWAFPLGKSLYAIFPKLPARCHKTLQTAGALGALFDSNYEDGEYTVDHVDAPAVFRKDQEAWTFLKKGKLRLKKKEVQDG